MHKNFFRVLISMILISACMLSNLNFYLCVSAENVDKEEIRQVIEDIYNNRSEALVTGDPKSLSSYFDTSQTYGKWALEHEVRRVKYLKDWSEQRGIKFNKIESTVRIKKAYNNGKRIRAILEESYKFDYFYPKDEPPVMNSYGVGIRHVVDLIKNAEDKYVIYTDWYTDCFEDALASYTGTIPSSAELNNSSIFYCQVRFANSYNREKAVQYADKYCGAAWGSGNEYKYNKKYMDYTGIGGDCTNFVSQVIGDKEGGGLRQDGGWHYNYGKYGGGEGSRAWVNTDAFKDYLLYSGKGSIIKRGTFPELTKPTPENPNGAIGNLEIGDLVCYAKKSDIDHFAVVTGFDNHGYPLVNSHTTDRFHVPWDLGWNDSIIKFYLIHIRD